MTNAEGQQQLEERRRQEEERLGLEAQAAQDKINDYANVMIKRDKADPHRSKSDWKKVGRDWYYAGQYASTERGKDE